MTYDVIEKQPLQINAMAVLLIWTDGNAVVPARPALQPVPGRGRLPLGLSGHCPCRP